MDSMQIASDRKSLVNSCRRVRVSVSWPPYTPASTFRLVSLIPEPRLSWRNANPIVVTLTGGAGPLAHNATTTLQAQGYDSTGAPIADLIYSYYVQPDTPPGAGFNHPKSDGNYGHPDARPQPAQRNG